MGPQLADHESFALLQSWGEQVVAQNRSSVVSHYAWKGTLWPTLSNVLRQDPAEIEDYFVLFLGKIDGVTPVVWNEKVAQPVSNDTVMWSGIYTFGLNSGSVPARFSYLVKKVNDQWKIIHHHSSQMPEIASDDWKSTQIGKDESFAVLKSWGNAVQAQNRSLVLTHYAENGTLWPTLSNNLRLNESRIENYFVMFLAKIDGIGPVEWNQAVGQPVDDDTFMWSGIYTFSLNTGKVRARFSYLVKKIDGEWK